MEKENIFYQIWEYDENEEWYAYSLMNNIKMKTNWKRPSKYYAM